MKKRKGFTLIELLAVIVILAIIAVIATPIIVGIIEDSRKAAFERSVEGIVRATDIDFGIRGLLEKYTYTISNGVVNTPLKAPIKNIDGFSGTIKYDEKGNSTYAVHNNKWCMIKVNGVITTTDYVEDECEIPNPYANGKPIYFDVVNGVGCTNYHPDNSLTGYNGIYEGENSTATTENQNSCLKFYAFLYNEGDTEVNLLLDHNTTGKTYWTDSSTSSNANGPITVLSELKTATDSWAGTITPANYTVTQTGYGNYTIPYTTNSYKARLITADEIAQITGNTSFDESTTSSSNYFFFDTNTTNQAVDCKSGDTTGCDYGWLYDRTNTACTTYGCYNNADSGMTGFGYWTSTAAFGNSRSAWGVRSDGGLINYYVDYVNLGDVSIGAFHGVRPVITVLKSNL